MEVKRKLLREVSFLRTGIELRSRAQRVTDLSACLVACEFLYPIFTCIWGRAVG
jgi:hypothetical protein